MSEMIQLRVHVQTNRVGSRCECTVELDAEDLPDDPEKRAEAIEECAREAMWNMIDWGYEEESATQGRTEDRP